MRRQLAPLLRDRHVLDATSHPSEKFSSALEVVGSQLLDVRRRGKFLLIDLDDGRELIIHLGMTGVLRPTATDTLDDPYVRARWHFADGTGLEFRDVRRFGRIAVVSAGRYTGLLASLGPEPFDEAFTPRSLYESLRRSTQAVKTQLLGQRPVAGLGNIYADEALWSAQIHPARHVIGRPAAARLHGAIRDVLRDGIAHGGTTLRDYRTVDGGEGGHQHHLACYGRGGLPCERCGRPLSRITVGGRTTTLCRSCQR